MTATDPYGNTDTSYGGSKNLTYSGANSSTNPVTAPTVTNNAAAATNFGTATTNTFTNGVSNTTGGVGSMKLYKAETANVAVTDGTIAASSGTDRLTVNVTARRGFAVEGDWFGESGCGCGADGDGDGDRSVWQHRHQLCGLEEPDLQRCE